MIERVFFTDKNELGIAQFRLLFIVHSMGFSGVSEERKGALDVK